MTKVNIQIPFIAFKVRLLGRILQLVDSKLVHDKTVNMTFLELLRHVKTHIKS